MLLLMMLPVLLLMLPMLLNVMLLMLPMLLMMLPMLLLMLLMMLQLLPIMMSMLISPSCETTNNEHVQKQLQSSQLVWQRTASNLWDALPGASQMP